MDVSVLGRIGYDLYSEEEGVPLKDVRRFSRYLGGSSANTAIGLSRLGLKVGLVSCLGEDPLSQYLVDYLLKEGVETRWVQRVRGWLPSLCLTEISPPDQFPQVFYRDRSADVQVRIGPPELDFIAATRLFVTNGTSLCASPSRESTLFALERAKESGTQVAFDVDYRAMSWQGTEEAGLYARLVLPMVDLLIANPEEICMVAQSPTPDEAVERLARWEIPAIAAKLGSKGTRLIQGGQDLFMPSYPVEAVSTIGAGDGFAAGLLYARSHDFPAEKSLQFGNATAALVVSRVMCSEAMPTLAEVESLIASHPDVRAVPWSERRAV